MDKPQKSILMTPNGPVELKFDFDAARAHAPTLWGLDKIHFGIVLDIGFAMAMVDGWERFRTFARLFESYANDPPEGAFVPWEHLVTAAMEFMGKPRIDSVPVAMMYACSDVSIWREQALRWMHRTGNARFLELIRDCDGTVEAFIRGHDEHGPRQVH
ncbi:MAG: hypothetical protein AB7O49_10135 [Sphingomonadales bacterium]